jgi:hypothetical protein
MKTDDADADNQFTNYEGSPARLINIRKIRYRCVAGGVTGVNFIFDARVLNTP